VSAVEVHHAVPRCLLRLREQAEEELPLGGHLRIAWLEFEHEAERWGVPVQIAREDLQKLVEASAVVMDKEKHRLIHESDWKRWGRRGGLQTVRRYGRSWMALLALKRWGRISAEDLEAARPLR
jgi:hypothetical protein